MRADTGIAVCAFAVMVVIVGFAGYAMWEDAHAEKFSLRKDSWVCTESHHASTTTFQSFDGGKTQIPITTYSTVCDQWTSKAAHENTSLPCAP